MPGPPTYCLAILLTASSSIYCCSITCCPTHIHSPKYFAKHIPVRLTPGLHIFPCNHPYCQFFYPLPLHHLLLDTYLLLNIFCQIHTYHTHCWTRHIASQSFSLPVPLTARHIFTPQHILLSTYPILTAGHSNIFSCNNSYCWVLHLLATRSLSARHIFTAEHIFDTLPCSDSHFTILFTLYCNISPYTMIIHGFKSFFELT